MALETDYTIFQPNASDIVRMYNLNGNLYWDKTVHQVFDDISAIETNVIGIVLGNGYGGYFSIIPIKRISLTDYHIGDNTIRSVGARNWVYWEDTSAGRYYTYESSGSPTLHSTSYNAFSIDGITYQGDDFGQTGKNMMYFLSTVSLIINNVPYSPVTYIWQSVASISGKNGILSLVTLDSESINDGEPVSGAAVSVFDQAPSNDNNIKNLADTYGGGEASSAVDVTVKYKVTLPPGGIFDVLKLVAKKGSEPEDVTDGDKIVNISANKTKKTVTGLDENSMYYFKIFAEDSNGSTSESNEKHITTSGDEGWSFDYTGQIQTFVAPKTGIYSLETWGAQGGDATDGTLTARGGYGAYAYGEVLLQQGETIYINVGGQNGYGGGGNASIEYKLEDLYKSTDLTHYVTGGNGYDSGIASAFSNYKNSDYFLFTSQTYNSGFTLESIGNEIVFKRNAAYGYILIPFRDTTNIVKVEFDLKVERNVANVGFHIYLKSSDFSTNMEIYDLEPMVQKDWTHIEYDVPSNRQNLVYNYFQVTAEDSYVWIKNVRFTCN